MPAYNESLADQILACLENLFPKQTSASHLKSHTSEFVNVPDEEWTLTVEALLKKKHITGKDIRTGFDAKLHDILNLEITKEGLEALQQSRALKTSRSYYWALSQQFGLESWTRWKGKIATGLVGAVIGYFVQHDSESWIKEKNALIGTALGIGVFLIADLVRSPWLLQKQISKKEPFTTNRTAGVAGIILCFPLVCGALLSVYMNLTPRKHKYAIAFDDPQYINVSNTLHAFRHLSVQSPNCFIRITAPFKNRGVAQVLTNLGGDFCRIDSSSRNPAEPPDDILKGSVDNGIVIHMAKEPQTRDGFVVEMGNAFAVRRSYDMPPGSPPDLIWIQVGRGYPFKKDDGGTGID